MRPPERACLDTHTQVSASDGIRTRGALGDMEAIRSSFLSIRMVAGYSELIAAEQFAVAEARYVPNAQFLTIPFRSELVCADYS